tara:strand:- start:282 stop:1013 length:732 start_codon:yes stop_codon:yes gene_type:complete
MQSPKVPTALIAGHFPIVNQNQAGTEYDDLFGIFQERTFESGCKIVAESKKRSGNHKLALLCDDHTGTGNSQWYLPENDADLFAQKVARGVKEFYQNFQMPDNYQEIMDKHSITTDDFINGGAERSLLFSEGQYRRQFAEERPGQKVNCAGEYELILRDLAEKGTTRVVTYAPQRCYGPTCNAVNNLGANWKKTTGRKSPLRVTHIYLPTGQRSDTNEMLDTPEKLERAANEVLGGIHVKTWG